MIISDAFEKETAKEAARRARVVVLGEFSAGKSTLINLLTGGKKLRTQVTATQMPAVWMSYGLSAPYRVDLEGNEHPVDLSDLSSISTTDTAYIRVFMKTPVLELCDFIDTPGNSDPNIAAIAWERVAEIADVAVWLSPSTQAWRQSELAAWSDVPERVRERSILLLTRADKLTSDEDRAKVLKRIQREAGDQFSKIHMVSLLEFEDTHDFLRDLIELCQGVDATQAPDHDACKTVLGNLVKNADPSVTMPQDVSFDDDVEAGSQDAEDAFQSLASSVTTDEIAMDEAIAAFSISDNASSEPTPAEVSDLGHATALWIEMTERLSADDADDLDKAFQDFLAKLDSDFATLSERASMKIAG